MSFTLLILLVACGILACNAITPAELAALKTKMTETVLSGGPRGFALCVRLGFHDCVGTNKCDGCIDHGNEANAGLEGITNRLDREYNRLSTVDQGLLTKADWYALCGVVAVETLLSRPLDFKVGRPTTEDCSGVNTGVFPNSLGDFSDTVDFFKGQFNFDEDESLFIMGAHSLGMAHEDNSGFRGPWTRNPDLLDNEYYKVLVAAATAGGNQEWTQQDVGDGHWQWQPTRTRRTRPPPQKKSTPLLDELIQELDQEVRIKRQGGGGLMMLNADMCFVKDITVNDNGVSSCTPASTCPDSPTTAKVNVLANDNAAFADGFIKAFTKMVHFTNPTANQLTEPAEDAEAMRQIRKLLDRMKQKKLMAQRRSFLDNLRKSIEH